jgi:hypothetical protein
MEEWVMKANYRRGGLFMLPFVAAAIVLAIMLKAPMPALLSIGIFGFVASIVLILLGDKRAKSGIGK